MFAPLVIGLDFGDHVAKGVHDLWFIILMAVNLQTSFDPAVRLRAVLPEGHRAGEVKIQSIYLGIIPFVLLQLSTLVS